MRRFVVFTTTLVLAIIEPLLITAIVIIGTAGLQISGIATSWAIWLTIALLGIPLSIAGLISIKGIRNKLADRAVG